MAKIIKLQNYKEIQVNPLERTSIGFGSICDQCGNSYPDSDMIYIPVLNMCFDQDCAKKWNESHPNIPEDDMKVQDSNLDRVCKHFHLYPMILEEVNDVRNFVNMIKDLWNLAYASNEKVNTDYIIIDGVTIKIIIDPMQCHYVVTAMSAERSVQLLCKTIQDRDFTDGFESFKVNFIKQ